MNIQNQPARDSFGTADFSLAIFLFAEGVTLLKLAPTDNPKKILFVFKRVDNLDFLIQGFWDSTIKIAPLELLNAERELKRLLHSDSYQSLNFLPKGSGGNS